VIDPLPEQSAQICAKPPNKQPAQHYELISKDGRDVGAGM